MADFFSDFLKILKLDIKVFEKVKNDKTGFWFSLRLFLIIAILATVGQFTASMASQRPGLTSTLDTIAIQAQDLSVRFSSNLSAIFSQISQLANNISTTLEKYQPPLGREASNVLRGIGAWLSTPLYLLSGWMIAAFLVFIVAKLFKGKGEIREHFSLFLLGFSPQILVLVSGFSFLNPILSVVGSLLSLVAWIWSLVIVTIALDVAHDFGKGKAFAVLVITFLIFAVLIPLITLIPLSIGIFEIFQ
jgi:hypothetical protein